MKKYVVCMAMLILAGSLFANEIVEGLWKSIDEEGVVTGIWKIYVKDSKLYGELQYVPNEDSTTIASSCRESYKEFPLTGKVNEMPLLGTPFIYKLEKKSDYEWRNGYIIDPANGKYYWCKIKFHKAGTKKYKVDTLEMRGEISWGLGRSQYWVSVTQAELDKLLKK